MGNFSKIDLADFLASTLEPFSVEEATRACGMRNTKRNRDFMQAFLISNSLAFRHSSEEMFLSRAGLFTGACFSICPTPQEIRGGYLIIGHRCMPFLDSEIYPHEITAYFCDDRIETQIKEFDTSVIYRHYALFGDEFIPQILVEDNPSNKNIYDNLEYEEPSKLSVHVWDMASIFWKMHFKHGDRLVVTILDWQCGIVQFQYFPKENATKKHKNDWCELLEKSLLETFSFLGPGSSIEEQVLFSLLLQKQLLLEAEFGSVEECVLDSKVIEIAPYGVESRLWEKDKEIQATSSFPFGMLPAIEPAPLEILFDKLDLTFTESTITAYILDSCSRQEKDVTPLLVRLVPNFESYDTETKEALFNILTEFRDKILENYNPFVDANTARFRKDFIDLHSSVTRFLKSIDDRCVPQKELPTQPFVTIMQLYTHLTRLLDARFAFVITDSSVKENDSNILLSLEGMQDSFIESRFYVEEAIQDYFKDKKIQLVPKSFKPKNDDLKLVVKQVSYDNSDDEKSFSLIITEKCSVKELKKALKLAFDCKNRYDSKLTDLQGNEVKILLFVSDAKTGCRKIRDLTCTFTPKEKFSQTLKDKVFSIEYLEPCKMASAGIDEVEETENQPKILFFFEEDLVKGFSKEELKAFNIKLK